MKGSISSHSQPQPVPWTGSLVLEASPDLTPRAGAGINPLHGDVMWAAALRRLPLFSTLSEERLRLITRAASMKTFDSQAVVVTQGTQTGLLYVLLSGRAVVYRTNEQGREVILRYLPQGAHFGEMSLVDGLPHSASVRASQRCEVLMLREADFARCLSTEPMFCTEVMKALSAQLHRAFGNVGVLALMDTRGRVAQALVELSEEVAGQRCIRHRVCRSEMGKRVGASREMVSRMLAEMECQGLITTNPMGWVTLNMQPIPAPVPD
ncbi:MAG: Crp/Fnr family transcriptional regulator [Vitreoscilla sp.]|nr:Crp/Fnr family transcriptional regulator [Vitreoscilla sp.]